MKSTIRIVFMGTPDFAKASLKQLVDQNYNVVGVVTAPDKKAGRGQKIKFSSVKEYALKHHLKLLQPNNLKEPKFIQQLASLKADLHVVVAFRMLPEVVWKMPPKGTFNLHASLLPSYRGAAPINWAIMNGDNQSGVSTFFIEKDIDTGKIIFQEKVSINDNETAGQLHDKLMNIGSQLVIKTINSIEQNTVVTKPQEGNISSAPKIFKEHCKIDWSKEALEIHNKIRGLSPYPTAWTYLDQSKSLSLKLFKSNIEHFNHTDTIGRVISDHKSMKVCVKDGYVEILELQLSGKKRMKTEEFLRGYSIPNTTILK